MKNALDRIKALNKISDSVEKRQTYKGNILSKGVSLSADAKEQDVPAYTDLVVEKVKAFWALPIWLARQKYSARVTLFLTSTGAVERMAFDSSSGNPEFDALVRDAVQQASPFPAPPVELRRTVNVSGIRLGFPL